jgi:hypothetical protein
VEIISEGITSSRLPAVKERLNRIKSMLAAVKGREG